MRWSTFSSEPDTLPNPSRPPAEVATIFAKPTIWFLSSRFCSSLSWPASALMYDSYAPNRSSPGFSLSQVCRSS